MVLVFYRVVRIYRNCLDLRKGSFLEPRPTNDAKITEDTMDHILLEICRTRCIYGESVSNASAIDFGI